MRARNCSGALGCWARKQRGLHASTSVAVRASFFRLTWVSTRTRSASTRSPTWSRRVRDWAMRGIGCWSLQPGAGPGPTSRTRIARASPVFAVALVLETGSRAATTAGMRPGFDYVVHKGALVDMIFGVEYQHFDLNGARAFCVRPGCNPPAVRDFDLSATRDLVRARLTIKTQGFFLVR